MFRVVNSYDKLTESYSINFEGHFTDGHQKQFEKILADYELERLLLHPSKKPEMINKKLRKCRFCGLGHPDVTFNKIAHVIPELMGNRHIISDFECDSCNSQFTKYEDALAKFLGITRTISSSRGKEGIPTFKNPDKKVEARKNPEKDGVLVHFQGLDKDYFEVDESKKEITIKTTRHPYKPIYVYKCLLKIALSLLDDADLRNNYASCIKFLNTDEYDADLKDFIYIRLLGYFCPGPQFPSPIAILWKKKPEHDAKNIPTRTMVIHFQNYVYQIFLPFGLDDRKINRQGNTLNFNLVPPFLDKKWIEKFGMPIPMNIDLSDHEIKRDEKLNVTMHFTEAIFHDFPGL